MHTDEVTSKDDEGTNRSKDKGTSKSHYHSQGVYTVSVMTNT